MRGKLLAEYDRAAWHATDAVMAMHPVVSQVREYIAERSDVGWIVAFGQLNQTGNKFLIKYEAIQGGQEQFKIMTFDPAKEDVGWYFRAAKGLKLALNNFGEMNRPYNTAVLPAASGDMYIYFYPAQVKNGIYPLGADVRYLVSSDGVKIIAKRQMHKSIIESVPAREKIKVAAGYHSHVLSNVPEDTDVLLVLSRQPRIPEFVIAGRYLYTIGIDGEISIADRPH